MKFIYDWRGRVVGRIQDFGNLKYLFNQRGQLRGTYLKSVDKTLDGKNHYFGPGDQLIRLLDSDKI
jgi:hypothetical protein